MMIKKEKNKNIILLSGLDKTKYFSKELENIIKELVNNPINMVVIPSDSSDYIKNDRYLLGNNTIVGVYKTFRKIFCNLNIILLDNRIKTKDGISYLENADIIYLLGGDTFVQLEYLKETKYDKVLKSTNALIIGISAGAMNLAKKAYYSKDENYIESIIYNGLGLTNVTIDPHFDVNNEEQVMEIKKYSKKIEIVGLPNESFIIVSNGNIKYIGKHYIYKHGTNN